MSPILVRPVREQLEHDRVIRLLQTRLRRRFEVGINPGAEQNSAVGAGPSAVYPDVVLLSQDRGRKIMAVIEVETVESVNNLEALAEWIPFGRLKFPFHLYVPAAMVDVARRLCSDSQVSVAEIYSYHWIGDEMRFIPIYKAPAPAPVPRSPSPTRAAPKSKMKSTSPKASAKPASAKALAERARAKKKPATKTSRKPARSAKRR